MYRIALDSDIFIDEFGGIDVVRMDNAHSRRCHKNIGRFFFIEKRVNGFLVGQVQFYQL
jgi:hypothetical protein